MACSSCRGQQRTKTYQMYPQTPGVYPQMHPHFWGYAPGCSRGVPSDVPPISGGTPPDVPEVYPQMYPHFWGCTPNLIHQRLAHQLAAIRAVCRERVAEPVHELNCRRIGRRTEVQVPREGQHGLHAVAALLERRRECDDLTAAPVLEERAARSMDTGELLKHLLVHERGLKHQELYSIRHHNHVLAPLEEPLPTLLHGPQTLQGHFHTGKKRPQSNPAISKAHRAPDSGYSSVLVGRHILLGNLQRRRATSVSFPSRQKERYGSAATPQQRLC